MSNNDDTIWFWKWPGSPYQILFDGDQIAFDITCCCPGACCFCGMAGRGSYPTPGSAPATVHLRLPAITKSGGDTDPCHHFCESYGTEFDLTHTSTTYYPNTGGSPYHTCIFGLNDQTQEGCDGEPANGEDWITYDVSLYATCYENGLLDFKIYLSQDPDLFLITWQLTTAADIFCKNSPIDIPYSSIQGGSYYYNCWTGYTESARISWVSL